MSQAPSDPDLASQMAQLADNLRALRDLERELQRQGFVTSGEDGLQLTPRAVRRLGETALRRVFAQLEAGGPGDHDDRRTGSADEPTGLTRPWEFGDDLPWDAVRTVGNAVRRGGVITRPGAGTRPRASLLVEDFEVVETERRVGAAGGGGGGPFPPP